MDRLVLILLVIFVIIITLIYLENRNSELTYVTCKKDNNKYLVRNTKDRASGADTLAEVCRRNELLIDHLKKNNKFNQLVAKYNSRNISESMASSNYTSYSVNKGDKIVLCIRDKSKEGKIIDINTIMFVTIHELAHIETKSIGHTPEFWDNMKKLLIISEEIGIYKGEDYSTHPKKYCGLTISNTPLYGDLPNK